MKRLLILFIVLSTFSNAYSLELNTSTNGYNSFEWGTTIEHFLVRHPNAVEITRDTNVYRSYSRHVNFKVYRLQYGDNNGRHQIRFYFFDNMLYRVEDFFHGNMAIDLENIFLETLITNYGPFDRHNVNRDGEGNVYWDLDFYERDYGLEFYLTLGIRQYFNRTNNNKTGTEISIRYINIKIEDDIMAILISRGQRIFDWW